MVKCIKCGIEEGRGKRNICRKCWRKEHTKKNKEKLAKQGKVRYLRNRERNLKNIKKWHKNNPERVKKSQAKYANGCEEYKRLERIRSLTRQHFTDLKDKTPCQICGSKKQLEFHHSRPYDYRNFIIVCHVCHREIEETFLQKRTNIVVKSQNLEQGEKINV